MRKVKSNQWTEVEVMEIIDVKSELKKTAERLADFRGSL